MFPSLRKSPQRDIHELTSRFPPKSHQLLVRLISGVIASDDDAHVVIIPEAVLVSRARETAHGRCHMWTPPFGKSFMSVRARRSGVVICPAFVRLHLCSGSRLSAARPMSRYAGAGSGCAVGEVAGGEGGGKGMPIECSLLFFVGNWLRKLVS
jgi:hypothetical protein